MEKYKSLPNAQSKQHQLNPTLSTSKHPPNLSKPNLHASTSNQYPRINTMARYFIATILAIAASTQASSVCDYYGKDCGAPCNAEFTGNTPLYCNTQQGASLGYTLDKACSLTFYSDNNCQAVSQTFGAATKVRKSIVCMMSESC